MNQAEILNLINRIAQEPSVLFLGQNYLSSFSGENEFIKAVNTTLCNGKLPASASYADIWAELKNGQPLDVEAFDRLYSATKKVPVQLWLRKILSMRWGMVYTSAVDSCVAHSVGANFTFDAIRGTVKMFKHEYMHKGALHGTYLYGSIDGCNDEYPPESCNDKSLRARRGAVRARIEWIYRDILESCGILVIDGWDPEQDWASFLLDNATDMLVQSIYLFGATPQVMENRMVQELQEDGILVACPRTFAQVLKECGYFDDLDSEQFESFEDLSGTRGYNVTIRAKSGKDIYLRVPEVPVTALDKTIKLMDDDLGYESQSTDPDEIKKNYAQYLAQKRDTRWALYCAQPSFHFKRKVDENLYEEVIAQLSQRRATKRKTIILYGPSNSGKTATLMELAVRLRNEHICPIFVIRGIPTQNQYEEQMKKVIKEYLFNRQNADGAWVEKVLILWDGNVGSKAIDRYLELSNTMSECNAVVVGTAYRHGQEEVSEEPESRCRFVNIESTLTSDETVALKNVIRRVDSGMLENFELAERKKDPTLLYTLQKIANYEYQPEWREVAKALDLRFEGGVDDAERYVKERIEERREIWDVVEEAIVTRGIGAPWQITLSKKLEEMKAEMATSDTESDNESESDELLEKPETLQRVLNDVCLVNRALALAGQFSVELPITLLLRLLSQEDRMVKKEDAFIRELLISDSLVNYTTDEEGYAKAGFCHPYDAERYVEMNFGKDKTTRKKKEVELLCQIIEACRWQSDEALTVIRLVRCFGPNSSGKYSDERIHGRKDYEDYLEYLPQIAERLLDMAEGDVEATVVFAHFMREASAKGVDGKRQEYLQMAKEALQAALDDEPNGEYSARQKNRLLGEICANLVASMPRSREEGLFDVNLLRVFEKYFNQTLATWDWRTDSNRHFDTNSLLDMWLNAVINYYESFPSEEEALANPDFRKLVTDSVDYIDRLLNFRSAQALNGRKEEFESMSLLDKINRVYVWACDDSMTKIANKLKQQGNDTYLYLQAHRCWRDDTIKLRKGMSQADCIRRNLFFLPDDQQRLDDLGKDAKLLKIEAKKSAAKAIKILEADKDLILRSKSCRCIYMLIRAKWLTYTDSMLLEEKQTPKLTAEQWDEIYEMCSQYRIWCDQQDIVPQIGPEMLRAVYLWCFSNNIQKSRLVFNDLRSRVHDFWYTGLIGFCRLGKEDLRIFHVDIVRSISGREKLVAQINEEISDSGMPLEVKSAPQSGRYKIHVPDGVLDYLFEGTPLPRNAIRKRVCIWFSTAGATLGIPSEKKREVQ